MSIIIREVVSEVVLDHGAVAGDTGDVVAAQAAPDMDLLVRRAAERVLETLRREWDR